MRRHMATATVTVIATTIVACIAAAIESSSSCTPATIIGTIATIATATIAITATIATTIAGSASYAGSASRTARHAALNVPRALSVRSSSARHQFAILSSLNWFSMSTVGLQHEREWNWKRHARLSSKKSECHAWKTTRIIALLDFLILNFYRPRHSILKTRAF